MNLHPPRLLPMLYSVLLSDLDLVSCTCATPASTHTTSTSFVLVCFGPTTTLPHRGAISEGCGSSTVP